MGKTAATSSRRVCPPVPAKMRLALLFLILASASSLPIKEDADVIADRTVGEDGEMMDDTIVPGDLVSVSDVGGKRVKTVIHHADVGTVPGTDFDNSVIASDLNGWITMNDGRRHTL